MPLDVTLFHSIPQGERERPGPWDKREKGRRRRTTIWGLDLTRDTDCARTHARHETISRLDSPPNLRYIYIYILFYRSYVNVLALYAYTYVHVATRIDLHNNWHDVVFMRWHYQFRTCQICIAVFDDPNHIVVSTLVRTTLCEFHMNVSNMCVWFHVCFVYDLKNMCAWSYFKTRFW